LTYWFRHLEYDDDGGGDDVDDDDEEGDEASVWCWRFYLLDTF